MDRRNFLQTSIQYTALSYAGLHGTSRPLDQPVTFGLIADPHADLMPDHMNRLEQFMKTVDEVKPDFIFQLGDFCFPKKVNQAFLNLWNQFEGPAYHTLGNHDMDISSKDETMDFWNMPNRYYSFDIRGLHVVVLDANNLHTRDGKYVPYDTANFYVDDGLRTFIDPEQLDWLKNDLAAVSNPTIIFSHQSLISPCWGIKNRVTVQKIIEAKNSDESAGKVIACFNGHDHIDYHRKINDVHYLEINSMAYQWVGAQYSDKTRYPAELYQTYPSLDKMAPYRDELYTIVSIDLQRNHIHMTGRNSQWIAPSPSQLGMIERVEGCQGTPNILERTLGY